VRFARRYYERFRLFIHEMAKFGIVGGMAFLVTELLFNLLLQGGVGVFAANAISTLGAAAIAFLGNRYWTFRHRERSHMGRETLVFFVLNGVGIGIQQVFIDAARLEFGRNDKLTLNAAFLLGVMVATLFRFWSYRKWVWRIAAPDADAEHVPAVSAAPVIPQVDEQDLDEQTELATVPPDHPQYRG
jgi:putative flippase GtrA